MENKLRVVLTVDYFTVVCQKGVEILVDVFSLIDWGKLTLLNWNACTWFRLSRRL